MVFCLDPFSDVDLLDRETSGPIEQQSRNRMAASNCMIMETIVVVKCLPIHDSQGEDSRLEMINPSPINKPPKRKSGVIRPPRNSHPRKVPTRGWAKNVSEARLASTNAK